MEVASGRVMMVRGKLRAGIIRPSTRKVSSKSRKRFSGKIHASRVPSSRRKIPARWPTASKNCQSCATRDSSMPPVWVSQRLRSSAEAIPAIAKTQRTTQRLSRRKNFDWSLLMGEGKHASAWRVRCYWKYAARATCGTRISVNGHGDDDVVTEAAAGGLHGHTAVQRRYGIAAAV